MEAIATQTVFHIKLIGQAVKIGYLGHGLMEGRIKNGHLGHAPHDIHAGLDTKYVGRIMQGRDLAAGLDTLQNLARDEHAIRKAFTAMNHAMTHRIYF